MKILEVFRGALNIPDEVFITIAGQNDIKKKGNDRKPLYINFGNPLWIRLFQKEIKKVINRLLIVEMVPNTNDIKGMTKTNKIGAFEFLLNWID